MTRKQKITISPAQKLEYAKLMVEKTTLTNKFKRCPVLVLRKRIANDLLRHEF
jgi:hypothetical protein